MATQENLCQVKPLLECLHVPYRPVWRDKFIFKQCTSVNKGSQVAERIKPKLILEIQNNNIHSFGWNDSIQ